jgi:hypothetical protein
MINDAFVWGGSMWTDDPTRTDFKRAQNTDSITDHNRWQMAETRFGDLKDQGMVTARANVIVSGNTTGAAGGDTSRGLSVEQHQIRCTWFAHNVPMLGAQRQHLIPSMVVPFTMYVLGTPDEDPLELNLPMRSARMSFPNLDPTGNPYVQIEGFFAVQYSDPWWMWKFLRDIAPTSVPQPGAVTVADDVPLYGAQYSIEPSPLPNGWEMTFSIPFAYIDGTLQVYRDGALVSTSAYTTSPETGQFTFAAPPASTETLWVVCVLSGGYA